MTRIHSFPPVVDRYAQLLILGSMPGVASLQRQQYYAHPQNVFWRIMSDLFGTPNEMPYHERLAAIQRQGIAIWDVLGSCERQGSLDSDIVESSIEPNDIAGLMSNYTGIRRLCFNGRKAESSFRRHIGQARLPRAVELRPLPSTSPAHAGVSYAAKLQAWAAALNTPLKAPL